MFNHVFNSSFQKYLSEPKIWRLPTILWGDVAKAFHLSRDHGRVFIYANLKARSLGLRSRPLKLGEFEAVELRLRKAKMRRLAIELAESGLLRVEDKPSSKLRVFTTPYKGKDLSRTLAQRDSAETVRKLLAESPRPALLTYLYLLRWSSKNCNYTQTPLRDPEWSFSRRELTLGVLALTKLGIIEKVESRVFKFLDMAEAQEHAHGK